MKDIKLTKESKLLMLQILKQGYIKREQGELLIKAINLPIVQVEIIDKTEQVEQ